MGAFSTGQPEIVVDTEAERDLGWPIYTKVFCLDTGKSYMNNGIAWVQKSTSTGSGGTGTVTSASVTTANGVSGSVAMATTTPAITLTLGDITPSSVASVGAVSGSNLAGTNTGDNATNTLYSGLVTNATHTGDATGATALTLATVNANVGAFTSANITVNAKGLITAAANGTGGGSSPDTFVVMGSNQANSTVTAAAVTGLATTVGVGTYLMKYWVCFQSAATTTGIQMYLQHTGTTTRLVSTWYTLTTGGAAATGIADQATTATSQMMEGKGQRASNIASGATVGVDTINADQFAVMEGIMVVTVSGTLNLMFNSEVAGSAVTLMTGTTLTLTKVA